MLAKGYIYVCHVPVITQLKPRPSQPRAQGSTAAPKSVQLVLIVFITPKGPNPALLASTITSEIGLDEERAPSKAPIRVARYLTVVALRPRLRLINRRLTDSLMRKTGPIKSLFFGEPSIMPSNRSGPVIPLAASVQCSLAPSSLPPLVCVMRGSEADDVTGVYPLHVLGLHCSGPAPQLEVQPLAPINCLGFHAD